MSEALALVLVAASWLLLFAQAVNLPSSSLFYRFADNLLLVGAVLSLVAAIVWKSHPDDGAEVSRGARKGFAFAALVIAVVATLVHYRGFELYPLLVGVVVGVSVAMLTALPQPSADGVSQQIPRLVLVGMAVGAVGGRYLIGGSVVQTWLIAPLFVLVVPGLAWTYALLPSSTGWMGRLFWAPSLSLGTQIVSLLWLDRLGVVVSLPVFIAVAAFFTLSGLAASFLPALPTRSEFAP